MHVSLVFTRYRPPHYRGGIERYVDEVGKRLLARGVDCEVVAFHEELESQAPVPARYVRVLRKIPFAPVVSFAARTLGAWRGRDRVLVQYAQLGLSIPGDRLYCVVHTTCAGEARSLASTSKGLSARLERVAMQHVGSRIERSVFRRARALIAISAPIKDELVEDYGIAPDRVHVLGNGVDCQAFAPAGRVVGSDPELRVLCVGRLVPRKNQQLLLHALARCDAAVRCTFAGDGPDRAALSALAAELGLQARVEFAGFMRGDALVRCYQQADLLVMPSVYEGMPMAILEAKGCGVPTLAFDFPGARELVAAGTGLVLSQPTPQALGEALQRLQLDRERLAAMAAGARRDALERFDWELIIDRLLELLARA